jgi:hypothetical protein
MTLLAAGPKAIFRAPFVNPDSRGNTGLKTTKRHDIYFPVTKTGTLAKYVTQVKVIPNGTTTLGGAPVDGPSYAVGNLNNYQWTAQLFRVRSNGMYDPSSPLYTEVFNPFTRQRADGGNQDLNCIILLPNVSVTPGLYVMSFRATNASPTTDWCSLNHSYFGIDPGIEGANRRRSNSRSNPADSFFPPDGSAMLGTANADGSAQERPATFQNSAPYAKYTPWYWLIYSDGSSEGQPYSGGPSLTSDSMNFRFQRKQFVSFIGAVMHDAGTVNFTVVLNGTTVRTGSITSTDASKRVFRTAIAPLAVKPTDTFRIDFTADPNCIYSAYCDAIMRGQVANMDATGPYWLSSNVQRTCGIFPLPWLPPLPSAYGALASVGPVVGTLVSTTATATPQIVLTQPVAAGSRIIVSVGGRNSSAVAQTIAADRGNSGGVAAQRQNVTANNTLVIGYIDVVTPLQVGDKITFTFTGGLVGPSLLGAAFIGSNLITGVAQDVSANNGSVSTIAGGSVGPTTNMGYDQELSVVAFLLGNQETAFNIGGGYTQRGGLLKTNGATNGDRGFVLSALPLSEAKSLVAIGAWSPSTNFEAVLATFRA